MNKIIGLTLFACLPLVARAACDVIPFDLSADHYSYFIGQLKKGGECRGVARRSAFTAVHYAFQATAGATLIGDDITGGPCGTCASNTYFVLLDPQGAQVANATNRGGRLVGSRFEAKLVNSGLYRLIVTGDATNVEDIASGLIDYAFSLEEVVPPVTAFCPADTYINGKLTINAVDVPNGFGGTFRYQASLSLLPFSNPLSFILDKADPLQ